MKVDIKKNLNMRFEMSVL